MATNSYVQVPPDSTGKKLYAQQHTVSGNVVQAQVYHLGDPTDPAHLQAVDNRGQAYTRFAEGSPSMDAFGNLRVSNARVLGAYEYTNGDMADLFTNYTSGTGQIEYQPNSSQIVLRVGADSGAEAERTTNRYHYYQPGVGNLIIMTLALSDSGKAGNVRAWGYGDHHNGVFFRLNGTDLEVIRLSTVSNTEYIKTVVSGGTPGQNTFTLNNTTNLAVNMMVIAEGVDAFAHITAINGNDVTLSYPLHKTLSGNITFTTSTITAVPRSSWNGDKLDGTGFSGMVLDLTKANFFWIDFAWLGVGTVRFGVLAEDGQRTTCHVMQNPNNNLGAYMATGSLPLHFHNHNNAGTSGTSEMKLICSAVYSETDTDYTFWRFSDIGVTAKAVTTNTPVLSAKPKIIENGKFNRIGAYPCTLQVIVTGSTDAMVEVSIYDDITATEISGATWAGTSEGTMIYDSAATAWTGVGGSKFKTFYLGFGCHNIELGPYYETNDEGYHVLADASDSYTFNVVATKLNGTSANVGVNFCYRELR